MKFPIAFEPGTQHTAWGVVVPDLPGCFSAGDTAEEALVNVVDAVQAHCEMLAEDNLEIPRPRPLDEWKNDPLYAGWHWAMMDAEVLRTGQCGSELSLAANGDTAT